MKKPRCALKCTTNMLLRAVFAADMTVERLKDLPVCKDCSGFHNKNIVKQHFESFKKLSKEKKKGVKT